MTQTLFGGRGEGQGDGSVFFMSKSVYSLVTNSPPIPAFGLRRFLYSETLKPESYDALLFEMVDS